VNSRNRSASLKDSPGSTGAGNQGAESARKNAPASTVEELQQRFELFLEHCPMLAFLKDGQGRFQCVSSTFEQMHGKSVEQLKGKTDYDLWERGAADQFQARDQAVRESGVASQSEEIIPLGGADRVYQVHRFPLPMRDGSIWIGCFAMESDRDKRRKQMLEAERTFTAAVLDAQAALLVVLDPDRKVRRFNESCQALTGWSLDEVEGEDFFKLFLPEESRAEAEIRFENYIAGKEPDPEAEEVEWITRTGERRLISEHRAILRDLDGLLASVIVTGVDVTEERRSERVLREHDAQMQAMNNACPLGIFRTDAAGACVYVNKRYVQLTGIPERVCWGDGWAQVLHPDDRENVVRLWNTYSATGDMFAVLTRFRTSEGVVRWVSIKASPVMQDGEVTGHVGTVEDVTEARHQQDLIRDQAELLDRANDAIIVSDLEGVILYWNASAERIFGWRSNEVLGRDASRWLFLEEEQERMKRARALTLEEGQWSGDLHPNRRDGALLVLQSSWTLIRDDEDQPKSILMISRDVTESRDLEQQFYRAQRLESIGVMASGIAHDLNNILAPIVMATDTIKSEIQDQDLHETIEMLADGANRGADLLRQVSLFSRGAEGPRQAIDLKEVIEEIRRIVAETFPRSIEWQVEVEPDLFPINGDATQIQQVLLNLCVNARDAMPRGGSMTLKARNAEIESGSQRSGPGVKIEVSDTGEGMSQEVADRVFEPFFTTKIAGEGTGLGLSTSRSIIRSHGGELSLESQVGEGTCFTIGLPALMTLPSYQETAQANISLPGPSGRTVLVVDDEPAIRRVTARVLQAQGFSHRVACDGEEAVELFRREHENLPVVILDMAMPKMDGATAVPLLKAINPRVKIIAASGNALIHNFQNSGFSGVDYYLQKPFGAKALIQALKEVLPNNAAGDDEANAPTA